MTAQHFMQNPGEDPEDISSHVLLPGIGEDGFSVQTHAESGSVAGSTVTLDDPAGTFYPIGLNAYRVYETDSESADPLIFSGGFTIRRQKRGDYRTGGSRIIEANMEDGNAGLSRYVVRADEDGDRPQETETERMEWLFTTSGMALHWDFATSILDLGSAIMSPNDYTDSTLQQVIDDMAQQTGKNYYVFWDGSVGNPPEALLVYAEDSGTHLTSDLRFSNVIADVDDETTFYLGLDTELSIDPNRIASYIALRYAKGRVDGSDSGTADEFSRIDRVMDGSYIKTASAANARVVQYLNELDTEETIVSGTVYLPATKASQFRAGMRAEMKATHLTGMSDFVWVRLLNVTCTQIATEEQVVAYALAFEGTFSPEAPPVSCASILSGITVAESGPFEEESYLHTGDLPMTPSDPSTYPSVVLVGFAGGNGFDASGNVNFTGDYTSLFDMDASPLVAIGGYVALAAGSPDTFTPAVVNWVYGWTTLAFSIPTAATAPVQTAQQVGSGGTVTFGSPLTPGNLLVMFRMASTNGSSGDPGPNVDGWTTVYLSDGPSGNGFPSGGIQTIIWGVYCKCVTDDTAEEQDVGEAGFFHSSFVSEWELS